MQRLRIRFERGEPIKYISHLDIIRLWERALRRAHIPVAYSEGFSPHPRMSLAVPLALGVTSEAELMDIFLSKQVSPHGFTAAVGQQMPEGMRILDVYQAGLTAPSLQSQVIFAEYSVRMDDDEVKEKNLPSAVSKLLATDTLPWQHRRDTGQRSYDLRALIDDLKTADESPDSVVEMRLRCDSGGSGRPEQVALALGYTQHPSSIHRTRLILSA